MNILQITSGRDVNGALVYARDLSARLVSRGHRVSMIARPQSWMTQQTLSYPLLTSTMNRFPPQELTRFANFVRDENIDVIHTHMSRAHHFGILLKLLTGVPVIATAHSRRFQLQWHFNDLVIANSQATATYLRTINRLRSTRIQTTHCFVELERFLNADSRSRKRFRRELHIDDDQFLIGVVGEVIPRKGHQYLFEALPQIAAAVPQARVAIIGRFNRNERFTQMLRGRQLRDQLTCRVRWLGRRSNIHEYMRAFDLTVMPSIDEPLGLVAIESQAAGVPVVASQVGGLPEIIEHGRTGWLVPPRNARALAEQVIAVAQSAADRQRIAEQARAAVVAQFGPEKLTREIEQAYERVCQKRRARVA